ncbi:ABC transporter substrate-binding protein [Bradyrhizobium sp. USDA 4469]
MHKHFAISMIVISLCAVTPSFAAEGTVRIGVLDDMTGPFSSSSGPGDVVAARLAVEDYGKLLSLPVEIVSADHQNKADIGAAQARRWFDTEGVDAVVGLGNSAVALAVSEIGRAANKVVLASGSISGLLTGRACSPNTVQWTVDSWSLANTVSRLVVQEGGDSWFFISVDYTFGKDLEETAAKLVRKAGGTVVGSVRHPLGTSDFASYLLQAQSSKAKVVALANGGQDMSTAIKQAQEFGLSTMGQRLVGLIITDDEIHALGLKSAAGLQLASPFYWDLSDRTRAFSERFAAKMGGKKPTMMQAGVYSAVAHYLKAVAVVGNRDGKTIVEKMKELPTDDPLFGKGRVRQDGRKIHDMHLLEVKSPEASKYPWDYEKLLNTVKAEDAFRPMAEGDCPLVGN